MKTKIFTHFLSFAVLVVSACTQAVTALQNMVNFGWDYQFKP